MDKSYTKMGIRGAKEDFISHLGFKEAFKMINSMCCRTATAIDLATS